MGEVHDGAATMDWMEEEKSRGITITSAATTIMWGDHRINIVDTPGHVDFTAEVERSLRALDGAIGVFDGVAGVEAQSETVWRQADRYEVPRLAFINKLDRVGADFDRAVRTLIDRLGVRPVVLYLPVGAERAFSGVVDVLGAEYLRFDEDDLGRTVLREPVPADLRAHVDAERERVYEAACDFSEELTEKFLEGGTITPEEVIKALRIGTCRNEITPVFCGAALRNKGIQPLLDGVVSLLPSPIDRGAVGGISPDGSQQLVRQPVRSDHFSALVFKLQFDQHGELIYTRVYSGSAKRGQQILVANKKKKERVGKIFLMHAEQRVEQDSVSAGEIVALRGIKSIQTGDTLCDVRHTILLEGITFPETVISQAIEPRSASDRDRLTDCLELLAREDPTFTWRLDEDTGQLIVNGMGELHLEIIVHRLINDWKVRATVGKPRVWYRQTVKREAVASTVFDREFGSKRHFAGLSVKVVPDPAVLKPPIEVKLRPERVPREFWPSVEEGLRGAAESGGYLGFPWIQMRVQATEGEARTGESTGLAFSAASAEAFNQAVEQGGRVLLEPIMRFDIFAPASYYGGVSSDLTGRRAEIRSARVQGAGHRIEGTIPLAETFGYMGVLRSLTQGRGTLTLEPCGFAPAPAEVIERFSF
jgi:elongation factor G